MDRLIFPFFLLLFLNSYLQAQIFLQEDFTGLSGTVSTDPSEAIYQIIAAGNCGADMSWKFSTSDATGTICNGCAGRRAQISYSTTCAQDATLVLGPFTPTESTVNISFVYGYNDFTPVQGGDFFSTYSI